MSEASKAARAAMKSKIKRITSTDPKAKVDASSWTPPEPLNADIKTGARPISPRAFKQGGKVMGEAMEANAGRKPRTGNKPVTADSMVNRNVKEANEEREGIKHVGAFKKGGRTKKEVGGLLAGDPRANIVPKDVMTFGPTGGSKVGLKRGGSAKFEGSAKDEAQDKKLAKKHHMTMKAWESSKMDDKHDKQESMKGLKKGGRTGKLGGGVMSDPAFMSGAASMYNRAGKKEGGGESLDGEIQGTRPTGGRKARKDGGRAKGKTQIHINIGGGQPPMGMKPPMAGPAMPPPGPGAPPPMATPPAGPPPAQPPGGMPAGLPPGLTQLLQGRKAGGRTYPKMRYGAGSGLGRLEKIEEYGEPQKKN